MLPMSSVVLSSQRVPLGSELFTVKGTDALGVNPLVYEGQKLVPSVTRVFSASRDLFVYLQAYERGATTTQPLVAFVALYRDDEKVFETSPAAVVDGLDQRSKAVPIRLAVGDRELSLFTTLTTFGTPRDVTLDELAVELFFPADDATEAILRSTTGDP